MTASRIGTSDRRGDAALKLTGGALYTADIRLPGMLHAKVLRSPHAHARLVSVDATKARALPGVHAILTRDELAGLDPVYGCYIKDQPVVAQDLVRYAGDVVAAVAADGEAVTPHALGLIEVVYEPLPAVPDIAAALTPDAPELFEKGAGEGAMVPVAAAVANAVHDATGARVTALPLSPERVFDALRSRVR